MKRITFALALIALLTIPAAFAEGPLTITNVEVTSRWLSQYMGQQGAIFHPKGVIQSDVLVRTKSGIYFDLWNSADTQSRDLWNSWGDELDYTVGFTRPLGKYTLDTRISLFQLYPGSPTNLVFPAIEVTRPHEVNEKNTVYAFGRIEAPFPINGGTELNGGYIGHLGIGHDWQIAPRVKLMHRFGIMSDTGVFGFEPGRMAEYSADLGWKATDRLTVWAPSIRGAYAFGTLPGRPSKTVWGFGLTYAFK